MKKFIFVLSGILMMINLYSQDQNFPLTSKYNRNICFDDSKEGYQESVNYFTKIITEYPDDLEAYYNLGMSHYKLLDFQKSIKIFNQLIEKDSCYIGALHNRAICKFFLKDKDGACRDFEKALQCGFPESVVKRIKEVYVRFCE